MTAITPPAEAAAVALQALLSTVPSTNANAEYMPVSRRLEDAVSLIPEQMPAIFINQHAHNLAPIKGFEGLNVKQKLKLTVVVYISNNAPDAVLSTTINSVIYSIMTAMAPPGYTPYQTLGNTVSHCWIEGDIDIIEGVQNGQGVIFIPVTILLNY